jgi:hypothetical protein
MAITVKQYVLRLQIPAATTMHETAAAAAAAATAALGVTCDAGVAVTIKQTILRPQNPAATAQSSMCYYVMHQQQQYKAVRCACAHTDGCCC